MGEAFLQRRKAKDIQPYYYRKSSTNIKSESEAGMSLLILEGAAKSSSNLGEKIMGWIIINILLYTFSNFTLGELEIYIECLQKFLWIWKMWKLATSSSTKICL